MYSEKVMKPDICRRKSCGVKFNSHNGEWGDYIIEWQRENKVWQEVFWSSPPVLSR